MKTKTVRVEVLARIRVLVDVRVGEGVSLEQALTNGAEWASTQKKLTGEFRGAEDRISVCVDHVDPPACAGRADYAIGPGSRTVKKAANARGPAVVSLELLTLRGLNAVCEMCGHADRLEAAFDPSGNAKTLCYDCRIGSAELLQSKRRRARR